MSVTIDLAKALDKAHEDKSLKDILDASPSALAGVTEEDAAALEKAFNIKTIRQRVEQVLRCRGGSGGARRSRVSPFPTHSDGQNFE